MSQPPPLETDADVIEWMLFHLDPSERDDFIAGLQQFTERDYQADPEVRAKFRHWYTSWIISIRLDMDPDYKRQAKESLERKRRGEIGTVVGPEELRARFSS